MTKAKLDRWGFWAVLFLTVAFVPGCGEEYLQSTINPVTDYGEVSHNLYVKIFWLTMVILAAVWALMAYILIRFREKPGQGRPEQIHGHMGLEIAWTVVPALIVVAIVIPTIQGVFQLQRAPAGEDVLVVEVTGKRYWWSFHYPELGVTTANELHLPVGRPVSLRLESADVIHSFWVPQLGGKRDVNPVVAVPEGDEPKRNWMHFTVREEGVFWGQCAEFCGEAHSLMGIRVVAESEAEFQEWVGEWREPAATANAPGEETAEDALVARGREVYFRESYCVLCHAIEGTASAGVIGPNLTRLGNRITIGAGMLENTTENIEVWLRDPQAVKPGAQMPASELGVGYEGQEFPPTNLDDEQIRAVAAYLSSMK